MTTRLALISLEHVHAGHYLTSLKRLPGVDVVAVAESDARRLFAHAGLLEGLSVIPDYHVLLGSGVVDGVLVCSANSRHKEMVLDFARTNVPILCEKPIATQAADAREMLAICQAHDVPLGICFPVRFSEPLRHAKRLIKHGNLGQVVAVKATNHGTMPGDWFTDPQLSGGGAVMDHTVHVVDALRWLFEAEFTQVFAHAARRLHAIPVEDVGLLTLEMSNEVFVTLDTSWSRPNQSFPIWGDCNLEIIGTGGVLSLELFPWTLNHYSESAGKHSAEARDGDLSLRLLENFLWTIQGRAELSATGVDGLRALEVVEAAYKSVATQQVVPL
ncbi:MAG: Gfo/Idh/MocA family oxidoreductase [Acidobacteria bacterium]|nr:Gfo/Idh/MocA family oxidoreductase [Acidobacteriota bacterium]MCI0621357.1 Gfo/Idh/MocA family oxidoreductase [Acidobacteriota bacterium]MCI0720096.1 Gfo/Idh/MocA family oxidoreductase [Acidobacteriota bacterium]